MCNRSYRPKINYNIESLIPGGLLTDARRTCSDTSLFCMSSRAPLPHDRLQCCVFQHSARSGVQIDAVLLHAWLIQACWHNTSRACPVSMITWQSGAAGVPSKKAKVDRRTACDHWYSDASTEVNVAGLLSARKAIIHNFTKWVHLTCRL
jgi:hypothetical protein